ncbi:DUF3782 domain-containing protein [Pyrofollis japonicus]|uniref:PD-(D/E)XK nuclease family protein n=1 Tax=Pyrofollis japonicus TaxID=3060460 RepID=UPI00295BB626|nr:DUF3782 domain-containing protein [Pyrofollis japonicus]BEP17850.1 DUF3782 domain-containing protein [Pyrofollis japonicus]
MTPLAIGNSAKRQELVREIIKAVEEDRELRYALLGALGFTELLERFSRLEERQQRLEERQQRLEEEFKKLEERFAQLEERFARIEERFARIEERQQEIEKRLVALEERVARLEEEMRETRRVVLVIAHRFGVISEEAFREAMRFVVEEVFGVATVEKWVYKDEEGFVYGYPSVVEVDVLVRDGEHILLEIKSRVSKADVSEIHKIGLLYERVEKKKPRLVVLGGFIDPEARRLAKRLGVEVIPITSEASM